MNFLLEIKLRQEAARKYNPVTETKNPKLNFSLNERAKDEPGSSQALNHFGFQVESTDDVLLTDIRLRKAGLRTVEEKSTVCCYALQDKIWVQDPDGVNWEVFVVRSDADHYRESNSAENAVCCMPNVNMLTPVFNS